jgi:peptide/nickel transport system ATP-binding protein
MTLEVENLTVYYQTLRGDVHALEGATFSVGDCEVMGLAGESACGKTTLAHSLILLKPPMRFVAGEVRLDGEPLPIADMVRMNPVRFEQISIVPQYAMNAMNPTRKIGRIAADLLRSRGLSYRGTLPELRRRLDLVHLPQAVLGMYPIELSGGMKQRMVLVLSTLLNPSLLLADEITSALDVTSQRAIAEMLVECRDHGFVKSMIVITHDLSILHQIADSILVMYAGQLAEKGSADTIIHRPLHPYTKLLISSLPEVGVRHSETRLTGIPGTPPQLLQPPQGCRFRDRCPVAFDRCSQPPPFVEVEPGHSVACWKVTDGDSGA